MGVNVAAAAGDGDEPSSTAWFPPGKGGRRGVRNMLAHPGVIESPESAETATLDMQRRALAELIAPGAPSTTPAGH